MENFKHFFVVVVLSLSSGQKMKPVKPAVRMFERKQIQTSPNKSETFCLLIGLIGFLNISQEKQEEEKSEAADIQVLFDDEFRREQVYTQLLRESFLFACLPGVRGEDRCHSYQSNIKLQPGAT